MAGRLYRRAQIRRAAARVPAVTPALGSSGVPLYGDSSRTTSSDTGSVTPRPPPRSSRVSRNVSSVAIMYGRSRDPRHAVPFAKSFIGLLGDGCRRLVPLKFEIHIARNARPFRHMLLDRGITLHRSAAVLAMPTLPIPSLLYPAQFRAGSHRAQSAIPVR